MKNSKKIAATLLASAMILGNASVFAAKGDLYKVESPTVVYLTAKQFATAAKKTKKQIAINSNKYYVEGADGKLYKMAAISALYQKYGKSYEGHLGEVAASDIYTPDQPSGDLEVIDISKVEKDGISVNFKELGQDKKGVTILVKNGDETVEVKEMDLSKGATSAKFMFKVALTDAPTGIWSVGNVIFNIEEVAAGLAEAQAAANADALLAALKKIGLKNVIDENKADYFAKKPGSAWTTRTEAQAFVNKINDLVEIKPAKEAENELALKLAFDVLGIQNYKVEWMSQYLEEQDNWNSKKDIQDMVDAMNALEVVKPANDAQDIFTLAQVFEALEIQNVKEEYMADYLKARPVNGWKTVEEIQKSVNDVNEKKAGEMAEAELVKALVDLAKTGNAIAVDKLLMTEPYKKYTVKYNKDWLADGYMQKFAALLPNGGAKAIQGVIYEVNHLNLTEVKLLDTDANANLSDQEKVDETKLAEAVAMIEKWAQRKENNEFEEDEIASDYEKITKEYQLIVNLRKATTAAEKKAALIALDADGSKFDEGQTIDMTKFIEANADAYNFDSIYPAPTSNKAAINRVMDTANNAALNAILQPIHNAANEAGDGGTALLAALKKAQGDENIYGVIDARKTEYFNARVQFSEGTATTIAKVQEEVNKVSEAFYITNQVNITNQVTEDTFWTNLKEFYDAYVGHGFDAGILKEANKTAYHTDKAAFKDDIATMNAAIKKVNEKVLKQAEIDRQVKAINAATTAEAVKTALVALANVGEAPEFLVVQPEDQLFLAKQVLAKKPNGETGFPGINEVKAALTDAKRAHSNALDAINDIQKNAPMNTVVDALEKLLNEAFNAKTPVEKVAIADKFMDKLVFEGNALQDTFTTLHAVEQLLIAAMAE